MKFFSSHKFAMLVTLLVVIFSILFGSHRSLTAARNEVEQVYLNGVDGGGSVFQDLGAYWATASNLASVAEKYLPDAEELDALRSALEGATLTMNENEDQEAYNELKAAAVDVLLLLEVGQLSEKDAQYVRGFRSEMESRSFSIANDAYNDLALSFNRKVLGAFPANILSRLVSIPSMAVFY